MKDNCSYHYINARKAALKEYNKCISKGELGYLPSLEGLVHNVEIVSEINLGIMDIPISKIIGTYTHLRSISFANNFLPLLKPDTEFMAKWVRLCEHHLQEGITDPIKVYEYLNWYYVIEGNKRVSIMKYFDAYSITAQVIRLLPKKDENNTAISDYYEYLKFNKLTEVSSVSFSRGEYYQLLINMLEEFQPPDSIPVPKYKYFEKYIYNVFEDIYLKVSGSSPKVCSGDAFIEYSKVYGIPAEYDESELTANLKEFIKSLRALESEEVVNLQTAPVENTQQGGLLSALTTLMIPKKKLKAAYAYARTIEGSGWTYAHELGRSYVQQVLGEHLETSYVENMPENEEAYDSIKALVEEGNDIIFTTSPIYFNETLKCAIEYPHVKFFNCSEYKPYTHVSTYYGRTFEPRFLTGIIAGAMTETDIIGYVATSPTPEVTSSINAFALGAKLVNPRAKVIVSWTNEWNSRIKFSASGSKLIKHGADILSNRTLTVKHPVSTEYGVYSMLCTVDREKGVPDKYLATPIWHWGIFYEKILRNIINGTYRTVFDITNDNSKLISFWWGMDSEVVDIFYSDQLVPPETQKLVNLMKRMIVHNSYHIFTGPIYDQNGNLRVDTDSSASLEEILSMNWFAENVEIIE
ncbi:MAG: BMP family ABC transporter substrate-binding protein [Bacillota bacterium]